jgi:predicted dehydrogenase
LKRTLLELPRLVGQFRRGGDYVATYAGEWRHFADAILRDVPLESTLEDGRRALEIVLAALEASETGRAVKLAGRTERTAHAR